MNTNRRSFLKTAAIGAAAPMILPSNIWAADTKPNDRITMGFIGMGKQSQGLLGGFIGNKKIKVLAVCDVDTDRRKTAHNRVTKHYKQDAGECKAYNDFREIIARDDIDAVCIATPDHWHAIPMLAALRSGKDVYCEKPLTHNIHEAIKVIKTVDKEKRVLQTGSMQRSMKEFRVAAELVQNGVIGKIERVECSFGGPGKPCNLKEEDMQPGLDWDMWCGPGPLRGYSSVLSPRGNHGHYPNWRNYKEYGGGMVCDWGAHHLDIAQWGLGMDDSGPVAVELPGDSAKKGFGAALVYANGVKVIHKNGNGVHFFGSEGEIKVNRGKFELFLNGKKEIGFAKRADGGSLGGAVATAERNFLKDAKIKLYNSRNHLSDFVNCVTSRKKPITSEQVGGRTAICCHLMNQAYYNQQALKWNPKKMRFAKGSGDKAWLTRDYRSPWKV